jgi:hypothetical protein
MVATAKDLWRLVKYRPQVDPNDLADAVLRQISEEGLDYRTRLLVRDSTEALRVFWGEDRFQAWLGRIPFRDRIDGIRNEEFERPGFPSLARRLMEKTDPEQIKTYFRELGTTVRKSLKIPVGGSVALIMPGLLSRETDDIDIVDEVPAELRNQHHLLHDLESRYGLKLAHFQRHYLPMGWENRMHYLDTFGELRVYLLDAYDVILSKLFSIRTKDLDDMREVVGQLDKAILAQRMKDTTVSMLAAPGLKERAEKNWYILFGESLPT